MNAIELFHQDGKSASVFVCGHCRVVARSKEEADKCCQSTKCQYCGLDSGRQHWTICDACRKIKDAEREAERFQKAEKLIAWTGHVFLEGTGRNGYSDDVGDFWDYWECDHDESDEKPKYVWACKENHFAVADIDDLTERIADNGWEDFDPDCLNGLDELKAAVEKFNVANKDLICYEPDFTRAVLLAPPAKEEAPHDL